MHKNRLSHEGIYQEYSTFDQFHSSIGLWNSFFLVKSAMLLIVSIFIIHELSTLSQYPKNSTLYVFGFASLINLSCMLRWMMNWPKIYRLVYLIVNGMKMLMIMLVSQLPVLMGFVYAAIFLFGFVASAADSFVKIFKLYIAMIFGDSLYGNYTDFSDGSETYNVLSFVFNTVLISILIWICFTAYTGLTTWVDHHFISQLTT